MERDDVIATLNDLIETSRDGEEGFRQCAANGQEPEPEAVFRAEGRALPRSRDAINADRARDGGQPGDR